MYDKERLKSVFESVFLFSLSWVSRILNVLMILDVYLRQCSLRQEIGSFSRHVLKCFKYFEFIGFQSFALKCSLYDRNGYAKIIYHNIVICIIWIILIQFITWTLWLYIWKVSHVLATCFLLHFYYVNYFTIFLMVQPVWLNRKFVLLRPYSKPRVGL